MPKSQFTDAHGAFIEALIALRKGANVTQVELADRLGRHQQFISRYERGDRRIDLLEFVAICRALRIDPKDAFATVLRRIPKTFEI